MNTSDTVSTRQAAKLLCASVRTVQIWVDNGKLVAWKTPGGHRRVLRASVDEMLAERQRASTSIPRENDNPDGLHQRYRITKSNGSKVDGQAEYFVLRLDAGGSDPAHIAASRAAAMTYADKIEPHIPKLAADLRARYSAQTRAG